MSTPVQHQIYFSHRASKLVYLFCQEGKGGALAQKGAVSLITCFLHALVIWGYYIKIVGWYAFWDAIKKEVLKEIKNRTYIFVKLAGHSSIGRGIYQVYTSFT